MPMRRRRRPGLHPAWGTAALITVILGSIWLTVGLFSGSFRSYVPVMLTSDRSGLVMESGGKVKMRGVQVGRVGAVTGGRDHVQLTLEIDPDQIRHIPANVEPEIRASTAFGAKYVDFVVPDDPSRQPLRANTVLRSRNVSTEANTVFQNLVEVLHQVDPAKLNATLTALADGVRGQGTSIGQAITDANQVLLALNPRMDTVAQDLRSLTAFSDVYAAAAHDILGTVDAASTTSATLRSHPSDLDELLLNATGFALSGVNLLAPNEKNLVGAINVLETPTNLLMKYNPEYTCLLLGAKWYLDNGGYRAAGGNGYSVNIDSGLLIGDDPYRYPNNLPIVGAKGGPGGKPGCGSLPIVDKDWPVRDLITDTGFGTGVDVRPNPGIGVPGYIDFFPVTRAQPEPPSIRYPGPPAPGPIPYPGAPPYGAPLYAPDGTPLYPGVPVPPTPQPPSPPITVPGPQETSP
jgi:phospholipid/cholesterol/gamma-HCH transport system substrate-binding protein